MRSKKKKLLKRILAAMLSVTLMSGTAVMTPIADIVGTNITAHATENIVAQGSYWKLTDDDKDGKYKLTFFGTIPNYEAILAEAFDIKDASAGTASYAELIQASWYFAKDYVTEVTIEEGTKTSADVSYLFSDFYNVTSMDLSNLDTSNATNMVDMFFDCTGLTSLNLSGWDTSKVENMGDMFYYCENLKTIIVGNGWNTDKVTNSNTMFYGCTSLVGGKGTTFDNTKTDKTYARIDSSSAPGYFTKSPIIAQGSYWKVTDEDADGNYKLTIFGTIPDTNGNSSKLPWYSYRDKITEVTTENGAKTSADASYLFSYLENATSMDLSHLDTSAATGMGRMFYNCKNLTSLNLSGWDTSNVTNMNNMFYSCEKLDSLDVSGFDTSNVTNMNNMFSNCKNLTSLDLSGNWDTSSVTGMGSMFYHCENLTSLNLSGFNTSNVTNMSFMFASCLKLTSLDLSGFDTSNVIYMNDMFKDSLTFTELDLSSFNTAKVQQIQDMFQSCSNLKTITVGNGWNTGSVTYSAYMFKDCTALVGGQGTAYKADVVDVTYAKVDGGTSAPGYLTQSPIIAQGSYWKLTDEDSDGNYKLTFFGTIPNTGGGSFTPPWNSYRNKITEVTTENGAKASADASYLFYNMTKVTTMDLSNLDTSAVTSMEGMFFYCSSLTSIDVSSFDTSNVKNFHVMFLNCTNLVSVNVDGLVTSSATNIEGVFNRCLKLTEVDLSTWDTSGVTNAQGVFFVCESLKTIYVGNGWDLSNVTSDTDYMFNSCTSLVGGKGTKFADAQVTNKSYAHIDGGESNPGYLTASGYTVTWLNEDGTTSLGTSTVEEGKSPVCPDNIAPVKSDTADGKYRYSLYWTNGNNSYDFDELPKATSNVSYTAQFKKVPIWEQGKTFAIGDTLDLTDARIYYYNYDGFKDTYNRGYVGNKAYELQFGNYYNSSWYEFLLPVQYGSVSIDVKSENYGKPAALRIAGGKGTAQDPYTFSAAPYYTVTWQNYDGTVLETDDQLLAGYTVAYNGETPTKETTAQYTYTFSGWNDGKNTYGLNDTLPTVTGDITYTAQFDAVRKPYFADHKLFLDGGIGICFYVNLTDEEAENATLDFNWLDQSCSNVGLQYDPVTGFYKAVCSVAASEMSSKITATLKINNEVKATDTYSAKECADKLIEGCDETTSKLVKTMLNYGAASQVYFGVDTNNPANASLSAEDNVIADVTPTMINVNTPKYTLPKGVKFAGATLSLRSETSLSIYISSKKAVTDAQCGDYTVETDKSGNYKVLRIRGIKAEDLGKDLTVTFTISDKQYSVTYTPMYYCRSVLMNSSADANLKTVVKAFYWYWQAAKEYADTAYLVS